MTDPRPVTIQRRVDTDHPAIPGHFPGHPVVPGVVLLSYVEQALRQQLGDTRNIEGLPNVKFIAPLLPGQSFTLQLVPATPTTVRFEIRQRERLMATGQVRLQATAPGAAS